MLRLLRPQSSSLLPIPRRRPARVLQGNHRMQPQRAPSSCSGESRGYGPVVRSFPPLPPRVLHRSPCRARSSKLAPTKRSFIFIDQGFRIDMQSLPAGKWGEIVHRSSVAFALRSSVVALTQPGLPPRSLLMRGLFNQVRLSGESTSGCHLCCACAFLNA